MKEEVSIRQSLDDIWQVFCKTGCHKLFRFRLHIKLMVLGWEKIFMESNILLQ